MPFGGVDLIPGINVERTPTALKASYADSQLIRFRDGLAEKIGGWQIFCDCISTGIARVMHAWRDLNGVDRLAVGYTTGLDFIDTSDIVTNITPYTLTTNPAVSFTTTIGSPDVQIDDPAGPNPITTYDSIFLNTPISIGGLVLSGLYPIKATAGATSYVITADSNATATAGPAGTVPAFTTTINDQLVKVTIIAHGLRANDDVVFNTSTTVGGLTIFGHYAVISVIDADNFNINAQNLASSSVGPTNMNSGFAQIVYYVTLGPGALGTGYGFGGYGSGGYGGSGGTTPTIPPGSIAVQPDTWTLVNWGEILLSCPFEGGVYAYDPSRSLGIAQLVATAPPFNGGIMLAMAEQILFCWGSTPVEAKIGAQRDPLLIKWSDAGDYTNFDQTSQTQAGEFRLSSGNEIVGALQVAHQNLFWTDIDIWAASYIQPPLVFGFNKIGAGCGLIGPQAACELRGAAYWMSPKNFWVLAGQGVEPMRCSVWDYVFQDLDIDNQRKSWAWANSVANEVWFFFPSRSVGSGECDSYVKFNIVEQAWDKGRLRRSAGIDQSVLGTPIAAVPGGQIYQHEMGVNDLLNPISWSFTTGYFYLAEGEDFAFVDQIIPDFKFGLQGGAQSAVLQMTFNTINYPGDTPRTYGPYTFTNMTQYIFTRLRARQMSITVAGSDIDSFARLGHVRFRYTGDGRR